MALTDIARQLKETFEGFGVSELQEELKRFREFYGDAESIRIGEMDYIVINDVYKSKEYSDVPESTSPLFFNSINHSYAIIDAETSSTLIDEVYSRVTYMQRVCKIDATPDKNEIRKALSPIIGEGEQIAEVLIKRGEETESNKANIFQCHLIKDTGVSAAPDVYSFMLKNGEIKEIPDNVMKQIRRSGEVNILKDRDVLEGNKAAIQQAVFDKYQKADLDIQNITVKSIFEISMTFLNIHLLFADVLNKTGVYHTSYLQSQNNEFAALNANIHVCNSCNHELVDVRDPSKVARLHVNMDAYDPEFSNENNLVHAVGCEECLTQCPSCGGWHFDYQKFIGDRMYEKVHLVPGRAFIRGLRSIEGNYCACREGIEWVYDQKSGTKEEHDIIPVEKMAFVNYANEKIASCEEYLKFYENVKKKKKPATALEESKLAKASMGDFIKYLAEKFDIDVDDIKLTSVEKCKRCSVCGGEYYRGAQGVDYDYDYRCDICTELVSEKRRMITRGDGIVFMRRTVKKKNVINKYIVTRFGNLKLLSSKVGGDVQEEAEQTPVEEESEE
jgi:ASC-1-like (ASCH) protein